MKDLAKECVNWNSINTETDHPTQKSITGAEDNSNNKAEDEDTAAYTNTTTDDPDFWLNSPSRIVKIHTQSMNYFFMPNHQIPLQIFSQ